MSQQLTEVQSERARLVPVRWGAKNANGVEAHLATFAHFELNDVLHAPLPSGRGPPRDVGERPDEGQILVSSSGAPAPRDAPTRRSERDGTISTVLTALTYLTRSVLLLPIGSAEWCTYARARGLHLNAHAGIAAALTAGKSREDRQATARPRPGWGDGSQRWTVPGRWRHRMARHSRRSVRSSPSPGPGTPPLVTTRRRCDQHHHDERGGTVSFGDRGIADAAISVRYADQCADLKHIRREDPGGQGRWSFSSQQATLLSWPHPLNGSRRRSRLSGSAGAGVGRRDAAGSASVSPRSTGRRAANGWTSRTRPPQGRKPRSGSWSRSSPATRPAPAPTAGIAAAITASPKPTSGACPAPSRVMPTRWVR